jgi:hypothetical protein
LYPSDDNYYFAHRTWFDLKGYVMLGKYPILPDNVYLSGKLISGSTTKRGFFEIFQRFFLGKLLSLLLQYF